MHRGAQIWGVSVRLLLEKIHLSGTTQVEQSDEHLVLLGRRIKWGGAVPARQRRVLGFTRPAPHDVGLLSTWERKRAKLLRPPLKPLHS